MDKLYTCEELAERYHVKMRTVWEWAQKDKIPHTYVGKRYYFTEQDIEAFEKARRGGCRENPIPTG